MTTWNIPGRFAPSKGNPLAPPQSRPNQVRTLVGNLPRRLSLSITRQCASHHPTLYPHHVRSTLIFSPRAPPLSQARVDSSEMEQTSSFQGLFNAALHDYQIQTGNNLIDHPLAKQLESCDSADSITAILQEQAQIFRDFRGDDGKFMKSLKCSVNVLYTLSITTEGIGLVHPNPFIEIPCF